MSPASAAAPRSLWWAAAFFAAGTAAWSWWRWWTFQYGTFDLAFYVQGLWLALRGEWHVSLLDVPLLGNHAEPVVFLLVPLFALWPHPMLLVVVQALALATAPLTAWRIARRLEIEPGAAVPLALTTLLTPATGFIALHEFHPEAFALPLLLLLAEARFAGRLRFLWLWWVLLLACKENLALLLVAWAGVHTLLEWQRPWAWHWRWNMLPLAAAAGWLALYTRVLSPALNAGNVDYLELYSHLGRSAGEIVRCFVFEPLRPLTAIGTAVVGGNLVWGLFLPLLGLPLLRLRWILISLAVLLPHLLSWRTSEWSLRFHYAAPLVPLLWLAAAETIAQTRRARLLSWLVLSTCGALQLVVGPLRDLPAELASASHMLWQRTWKAREISEIRRDPHVSVMAGHPYLSHLANRSDLHSLHHVLKGLKTLSRERYVPRRTDSVVIDYGDRSTFSAASGFYHPQMRTVTGSVMPSSDELLHEFLGGREWHVRNTNELSVFRVARTSTSAVPESRDEQQSGMLLQNLKVIEADASTLRLSWSTAVPKHERRFLWLQLVLPEHREIVTRGLLAPVGAGLVQEEWQVLLRTRGKSVAKGAVLLYEHSQAAWTGQLPPFDRTHVAEVHPLTAEGTTNQPR